MPQRIEVPGMGIVEFPDGMTDDQISAAIRKNSQPQQTGGVVQGLKDMLAGGVRGAGSIGATLMGPQDWLQDIIRKRLGGPEQNSNAMRRQDMTDALQSMGANPDSLPFQGGKLAGEIAGTLGVGGALANTVGRAVPALAPAIESAGFALGRPGAATLAGKAADLGTRMAGGAITGGAAAGLVNPDDMGMGAAVGGALPGMLGAAGAAGRAVGNVFASEKTKAGRDLAKALQLNDPTEIANVAQQLRSAQTLVPGSKPTVAQILQTPNAGVLERVVHDTRGGGALADAFAAQNEARLRALEGVAPLFPTGVADARANLGNAVASWALPADRAAKARTSSLFNQVPLDEASIYLPDLSSVKSKYFGPGYVGDRGPVDAIVKTAESLGLQELPGVAVSKATASGPPTLAQAVRKAGGISVVDNGGLLGEVRGLQGDLKNLVRKNGGLSPDRMAERMREAGYIADDSADSLFAALRDEAIGGKTFSVFDDPSRNWRAAAEAAMGDAPGASTVAKQVSLRDVQDLRSSIGMAERNAAKAGDDRARAAFAEMKQAIDNRIDEVVRGDGAIEENLPIDWANKLSEGLKSKRAQVEQFRTGPQAAMFRKGADGQPLAQGGEIATKFWGSRPGVAEDVDSFRRLIKDKPDLLGQFRSMVTTEGASTADVAGNLTSKFVKWVDGTLPGLKRAFDADQVQTLQRIADDIKRANAATGAGKTRAGSDTYQKANNALGAGLLDSPLAGVLANRIPVVNQVTGPLLAGLRDKAREVKAQRFAGLLSDPTLAADSLSGLLAPSPYSGLLNPALLFGYRAAPLIATDQ